MRFFKLWLGQRKLQLDGALKLIWWFLWLSGTSIDRVVNLNFEGFTGKSHLNPTVILWAKETTSEQKTAKKALHLAISRRMLTYQMFFWQERLKILRHPLMTNLDSAKLSRALTWLLGKYVSKMWVCSKNSSLMLFHRMSVTTSTQLTRSLRQVQTVRKNLMTWSWICQLRWQYNKTCLHSLRLSCSKMRCQTMSICNSMWLTGSLRCRRGWLTWSKMSQAFIGTSVKLFVGLKPQKMKADRQESCFVSHHSSLRPRILRKKLQWPHRRVLLLRKMLIKLQASCRCVNARAKTDTPFRRRRSSGIQWKSSTQKRNAWTFSGNAWPAARCLTGWAICERMSRRILKFAHSLASCVSLCLRLHKIVIGIQANKCAKKDKTRIETSENFYVTKELLFEKRTKWGL